MVLEGVGGGGLVRTVIGTVATVCSLGDAVGMTRAARCSRAGCDGYARWFYVRGAGRSRTRRLWGGKGVVGEGVRGGGLGVSSGAFLGEGWGGGAVEAGRGVCGSWGPVVL